MHKKINIGYLSIIFFAVVLTLSNILYSLINKQIINEEKNRYYYISANETNYISSCIDKVIVRTYTLREMILENDGRSAFFEKIAPTIYETVKEDATVTLRNIAIAPNGKISNVYPLESNESLLGFDFMDIGKEGNTDAMKAYASGATIITNPFELVQGGLGMAARTPVYLDTKNGKQFWGLVTATLDFDELLRIFNFENLTRMNVNYKLWYKNDLGEEVILSSNGDNFKDPLSNEFHIYNLSWYLDLYPQSGWYNKALALGIRILIFFVSIIITLLLISVFRIIHDGQMMKILAEQDSLTQTYSRHYLNSSILDIKTGNWGNGSSNYSVAIVDVDNFKTVNDTFGHNVGDRALISIANVLKKSLTNNEKDCIIRFGGDEFVVFYSNISRDVFEQKLHDINKKVNKISFEDVPDLKLSVSIGAYYKHSNEEPTYRETMQISDANLYEVKDSGRNNYKMNL